MDGNRPPFAPKKKRFVPKKPPPKKSQTVTYATDVDDGKDKEQQTSLGPNVEKKSSEHGDSSSTKQTYDPITLPLRKPNSGVPELDKVEEEAQPYDENAVSCAAELGLLEENKEEDPPRLISFQFPASLPRIVSDFNSKGKETGGNSSSAESQGCSLNDLPKGQMGKMLVYKSGAVKLKIGDVLLDVDPSPVACHEQVMAINKEEKHCCHLGDVTEKAVVSVPLDDPFFDQK